MKDRFWQSFALTWLMFFSLLFFSLATQIYLVFPLFSFVGYSGVIIGMLVALNYAHRKWHYIMHSCSLIFFGTLASLDIIMSKGEMAASWSQVSWISLNEENLDDYIQVLIVLLNIFTGSLAANGLFCGLNQGNKLGRGSGSLNE